MGGMVGSVGASLKLSVGADGCGGKAALVSLGSFLSWNVSCR